MTTAVESCLAGLQDRDRPLQWCLRGILQDLADVPTTTGPLAAALAIAKAVDAGALVHAVPFHHQIHFCEVTVTSHLLARLTAQPVPYHEIVVAAAVLHDLDHDGSSNGDQPFRLELHALAQAEPYLAAADVTAAARERISAIVLTTDIVFGLPFARAWYRYHARSAELSDPPDLEIPHPGLLPLVADPQLATLAVLLSEADALASAGLSPETAYSREIQLADERGWAFRKTAKRDYLDAVFPQGFLLAKFFNPNLEAIRADASRNPDHGRYQG